MNNSEHFQPLTESERRSLASVAHTHGTPTYVYFANRIQRNIDHFRNSFKGLPVSLRYAMKALSHPKVLGVVNQAGAGVEAVSPMEAKLALHAGIPKDQIIFTPSNTTWEEYAQVIEQGILTTLDSLPVLQKFAETYGSSVPCMLRINPDVMAGDNYHVATGYAESKFGIAVAAKDEILEIVSSYKLDVVGLHVHTGSDIADLVAFSDTAKVIFNLAQDIHSVRIIDLGSGFKVPYQPGKQGTDLVAVADAIRPLYEPFDREIEIWFEPGKFLVSNAGFLLTQVNIVKEAGEKQLACVNSGLNHLLRPMMYDAYQHIENLSQRREQVTYDVVGNICETDTLGEDVTLNKVEAGDILAIHSAGAYGITMASNYNFRSRPAEVLVQGEKIQLISKRETFEELIKRFV